MTISFALSSLGIFLCFLISISYSFWDDCKPTGFAYSFQAYINDGYADCAAQCSHWLEDGFYKVRNSTEINSWPEADKKVLTWDKDKGQIDFTQKGSGACFSSSDYYTQQKENYCQCQGLIYITRWEWDYNDSRLTRERLGAIFWDHRSEMLESSRSNPFLKYKRWSRWGGKTVQCTSQPGNYYCDDAGNMQSGKAGQVCKEPTFTDYMDWQSGK